MPRPDQSTAPRFAAAGSLLPAPLPALVPVPTLEPLFNDKQLAELFGLTVGAVAQMRRRGQGPTWVRVGGRSIRYRLRDVQAYLDARAATPSR